MWVSRATPSGSPAVMQAVLHGNSVGAEVLVVAQRQGNRDIVSSPSRHTGAHDASSTPTPNRTSAHGRTGLGELMTAVAGGDQTAFGQVYDLLAVPFYRLVLGGPRREDGRTADRAALDAWTQVWRDAPLLLHGSRRPLSSAEAVAWIMDKAREQRR